MGEAKVVTVRGVSGNEVLLKCLWLVLLLPSICQFELVKAPASAVIASKNGPPNNREVVSVCHMEECVCTNPVHISWLMVNCTFDMKKMIDLKPGSIPVNVQVLNLSGGREIRFSREVFTKIEDMHMVRVAGSQKLHLKRHSFVNLTTNKLMLDITDCSSVIIETSAFDGIKGPVSSLMARSSYVVVQQEAFSFLLTMRIKDVMRLDLADGAFRFKYAQPGHHGAASTIRLENVLITEIPPNAFSSPLAEIRIDSSEVWKISTNAFRALQMDRIIFANSSLHNIENGAFNDAISTKDFQIVNCRVHILNSNAIASGITNLTIRNSTMREVHKGGINVTLGSFFVINSTFEEIHSEGFVIKKWNQISIENNHFRQLNKDSFLLPFTFSPDIIATFKFSSNKVKQLVPSSLTFVSKLLKYDANQMLTVDVDDNTFEQQCKCDIKIWLSEIFGSDEFLDKYVDTSYCTVNIVLARCFNLLEGYINMRNYTEQACGSGTEIKCPPMTDETKTVIETISKQLATNGSGSNSNYLILVLVLSIVFIVIVSGTIVMLLIKGGLWLKRKGYCIQFSGFQYSVNDDMGTTEAEDIMVTVENKLNENLPNELTPELLEALREKLADPETYNEAREMIERLYDYFLVEDPYNEEAAPEETHLYEELNAARQHPVANGTETNNIDKTTPARPFSFLRLIEERLNLPPSEASTSHTSQPRAMLMGEYAEPMDSERGVTGNSSDVHVYSELPESARRQIDSKMALRPLPDKPVIDPGEGTSTQGF